MNAWLSTINDVKRVRGERGFADVDWHNGDTYLAGVIGTMALHHRDHGNTYPDGFTPDEWKAILTKIGEPLVAYADGKFSAGSDDGITERAQAALALFADYFFYFWD